MDYMNFVAERECAVKDALSAFNLEYEQWVTTTVAINKLFVDSESKYEFVQEFNKEQVHRQFSYELYCAVFNHLNSEGAKRADDKAKSLFDEFNKAFNFVPWYEKTGLSMASGGGKPKKGKK